MPRGDYQDRLKLLEAQARELAGTGRYEDSASIELAFRVQGHTRFYFDPLLRQTLDELCTLARNGVQEQLDGTSAASLLRQEQRCNPLGR